MIQLRLEFHRLLLRLSVLVVSRIMFWGREELLFLVAN